MILIDNYDSFTYNIVQYLQELGVKPRVFKNDEISVEELKKLDFESLLISPGPGNPDTAGVSMEAIEAFHKTKKILGVCLGHQCIAQFFGATIIKDTNPFHGKVSEIHFTKSDVRKPSGIFAGIPDTFLATRYHSLKVDENTLKSPLFVTAKTKDGVIMAIEHERYPIYGVQFHPEAILSEHGHRLLGNFAIAESR